MDLLFELIQVTLGRRNRFSRTPSEEDWQRLFQMAEEQAITSFLFPALEILNKYGQKPPMEILYEWIGLSEQIKQQNKNLNVRCLELQEVFSKAGFRFCVLKGQGNAQLYPNPLLRQCGDIDIWVEGEIKKIVAFLSTKCDARKLTNAYHHTDFPLWDDVEVEVHWRPSWKSSPVHNSRLQHWFREQAKAQFDNVDGDSGIHVPTWEFNIVYQLQHMYLHVLREGLGLRQIIDYYYLLKSKDRKEVENLHETLRSLDLLHFAGAIMYVLHEFLLLDEEYMIVPVDEERGNFLLSEILQSGNFGQADDRNKTLMRKTGIARSLFRLKRQFRFLKDYPIEVLCLPFQVYHIIWRQLGLWRL